MGEESTIEKLFKNMDKVKKEGNRLKKLPNVAPKKNQK